ncbi:10920_t:CDS:1, partial [Racocetra persica]
HILMEHEQNVYTPNGGNHNGQYVQNHLNDDKIEPDTPSTKQTKTEEITLQNGKFIRNCQIPSDLLRN